MTQQAEPDERDLIAHSQQGDRRAFNVLVARHQAAAYALALRMLGDAESAADVTQDAFVSAFRAVGNLRGMAFRPWLLRIVSNGCYDVFRARARHPASSLDALLDGDEDAGVAAGPLPAGLVAVADDPERVQLRADTVAAIQAALLRLPPDQRLAVILSDVEGMPYDEIARIMETPIGTVKSRIARARARLRELLTRDGELLAPAERPVSGDELHRT